MADADTWYQYFFFWLIRFKIQIGISVVCFSGLLFNLYNSKYVSTSSKYNLVAGAGADGPFNALCVFNVATNADLNIPYARFILCLGFKNCVSFLRGESNLLPQVSS